MKKQKKEHSASVLAVARPRLNLYSCGYFVRMYTSIDPAPPSSGLLTHKPAPSSTSSESISELRSKLLDKKLPLFERYRAMFTLRNIGTEDAVDALAAGFSDDSALFKFVLLSCPHFLTLN
jgi:hypothetical protein